MKVNNISFDLDGTLVPLGAQVEIMMAEAGYRLLTNGKHRMETEPFLDDTDIWKFFNLAYTRHAELEPYPGAREVLAKLYATTGQPVKIITARPFSAASDTYALTSRIFKKIPHEVILVQNHQQKLRHLHGIDYFVDDRRATARELAKAGKGVYVPRQVYNHMLPDPNDTIWFIDGISSLQKTIHEHVKEVY